MSKLSDAVDKQLIPILAVSNPGKDEIMAMHILVRKLVEYCQISDGEAMRVGHHLKNQDIEIERLRKKLKKARAQWQ